jgi:hypothetical protein
MLQAGAIPVDCIRPSFPRRKEKGPPMTFQIGMVGSDGIVIVGDTWQYVEPKDRSWYGFQASKMRLSESAQIGVAAARDMTTSLRVADQIIATLDPSSEYSNRREKILNVVSTIGEGHDSEFLIALSQPEPSLYWAACNKDGQSNSLEVFDRLAIGDVHNLAFFWATSYYRSTLNISQLARLGALAVISASRLNSGSVGGLEVMECKKEGCRMWPRSETSVLFSEISSLADQIGSLIFQG